MEGREQINLIRGLIEYSAKSELILEEVITSGIHGELEEHQNIEHLINDLSRKFLRLPTFFHASDDELQPFMTDLRFIDAICQTGHSHPNVVSNISNSVLNKFLIPTVKPTICKCLEDEKANYTSYLQIICENLKHISLVDVLFQFILSPEILNSLLETLLEPCTKKPGVIVSTLSLLKVLLDFYYEDFWYALVILYLAPQHHLIKYQRGVVLPDINFLESTLRFLSLIPTTVVETMNIDFATFFMEYSFHHVSQLSYVENSILKTAASKLEKNCPPNFPIVNIHYPLWRHTYNGADNFYNDDRSDDGDEDSKYYDFNDDTDDAELDLETAYTTDAEESDYGKYKLSASYESSLGSPNTTVFGNLEENNLVPENEKDLLNIVLGVDEIPISKKAKRLISVDPQLSTVDWDMDVNSKGVVIIDDGEQPSTSKDALRILEIQNEILAQQTAKPSFGPIIDCLFDLLNNWSILDMETILMMTDLWSTLASSRIPLITSILLDPKLILQPSYPSFQRTLNEVRVQMEALLQNYPKVLLEAWGLLQDHEKYTGRSLNRIMESNLLLNRAQSNSNSSLVSTMSTDSKVSMSSIMSNFGRKIKLNNPFSKVNLDKMRRRDSTISENPNTNSISNGRRGFSLFGGNSERTEIELKAEKKELDTAKMIGVRALLFAQWLLELGAIAQQTSWTVPVKEMPHSARA